MTENLTFVRRLRRIYCIGNWSELWMAERPAVAFSTARY
jgi:hypothetical protein